MPQLVLNISKLSGCAGLIGARKSFGIWKIWTPVPCLEVSASSFSSSIIFYLACWHRVAACFIGHVLQHHV